MFKNYSDFFSGRGGGVPINPKKKFPKSQLNQNLGGIATTSWQKYVLIFNIKKKHCKPVV